MRMVLVLTAAYLMGSIPFGYLLGKGKGVDLRKEGSGNIGATNALRVIGAGAGLLVLLLDATKGFIASWLGSSFSGMPAGWGGPVAGLLALVGHCFSVFMGFKGGKGVATALGTTLYLVPLYGVLGLAIFAVIVLVSKYSSLGTLTAVLTVLGLVLAGDFSLGLKLSTSVMVLIIVVKHRNNIRRLVTGKELPITKSSRQNETGKEGGSGI
jgi:glycerol-3-phosphate acyltransferase PlsY